MTHPGRKKDAFSDDEPTRTVTPKAEIEADRLTEHVIGAAIELHRALGPGRRERVYSDALEHILRSDGLDVSREKSFEIEVRGVTVGTTHVDLWIADELVVEVKSVKQLTHQHMNQLGRYVETAEIRRGLLINFGAGRTQVQRFTNFDAPIPPKIKDRMP